MPGSNLRSILVLAKKVVELYFILVYWIISLGFTHLAMLPNIVIFKCTGGTRPCFL